MAEFNVNPQAKSPLSLQAQSVLSNSKTSLKGAAAPNAKEARRVAEEFEAVFLTEVFKPMFDSIKAAKPFGGGHAEKMWRSLQVAEYGKAIARSGGVGIGDAVFRQMLQAQEVK